MTFPFSPQSFPNPMTAAGDLIAGGTGGAAQRLPAGAAGQILTVSAAGAPAWQAFNLAKHVYAPGVQATPTVSTTTMAAFDSTNIQTGSFTAPASGQVTVKCSFSGKGSASGIWVALGLAAHGTVTPLVANEWECELPTADAQFPFFIEFTVPSLTPGTSYNFDLLGCATSATTFQIAAIGKTTLTPSLNGTNQGGPVTFTVTAD